MSARAFQVTMLIRAARIVRCVIAHNPIEAMLIGLRMMPDLDGPVGITCKPIRRIA